MLFCIRNGPHEAHRQESYVLEKSLLSERASEADDDHKKRRRRATMSSSTRKSLDFLYNGPTSTGNVSSKEQQSDARAATRDSFISEGGQSSHSIWGESTAPAAEKVAQEEAKELDSNIPELKATKERQAKEDLEVESGDDEHDLGASDDEDEFQDEDVESDIRRQ